MRHFAFLKTLLFILLFNSCSEKQVNFEIENISNDEIDSIHIGLSGFNYKKPTKKITSLNPDEKKTLAIPFNNVPKVDGNYQITILSNGQSKTKSFGYYNNGSPSTEEFHIKIDNDTIIFQEFF